jgi:hypothetical protein
LTGFYKIFVLYNAGPEAVGAAAGRAAAAFFCALFSLIFDNALFFVTGRWADA